MESNKIYHVTETILKGESCSSFKSIQGVNHKMNLDDPFSVRFPRDLYLVVHPDKIKKDLENLKENESVVYELVTVQRFEISRE